MREVSFHVGRLVEEIKLQLSRIVGRDLTPGR